MTARRSRALVAVALALIFVAKNGALLYPALDERESTYVVLLARRMAALAARHAALQLRDLPRLAAVLLGRDTIYTIGDEPTAKMLMRIPYLRYGHNVAPWSDEILRRGAWVLTPAERAPALVAGAPGTQVMARNQGFVLLKGR